jgi:hypothetical protein
MPNDITNQVDPEAQKAAKFLTENFYEIAKVFHMEGSNTNKERLAELCNWLWDNKIAKAINKDTPES